MKAAVVVCLTAASLAACNSRDPVADGANNIAAAPPGVDVLPADESVATPTNQLENGVAEPSNASAQGTIPAALHGRWGMTPADCTSARGDTKGLLIVSGDALRFYESVARPNGDTRSSPNSISGDFDFTGEGMNWRKYQALELKDGKLVRTESDPMASFTYARCTS
jgi:hypothetical protein